MQQTQSPKAGERTQQATRGLDVLIEHAKEMHPHFESERGQRDISEAMRALKIFRELLYAASYVEAAQRPHCNDCECEQCEAWDKLVSAIAKAEGRAL